MNLIAINSKYVNQTGMARERLQWYADVVIIVTAQFCQRLLEHLSTCSHNKTNKHIYVKKIF